MSGPTTTDIVVTEDSSKKIVSNMKDTTGTKSTGRIVTTIYSDSTETPTAIRMTNTVSIYSISDTYQLPEMDELLEDINAHFAKVAEELEDYKSNPPNE